MSRKKFTVKNVIKAVLTFDSETTDNKVLVVYSVFDRIIEIDSQRNVNVI